MIRPQKTLFAMALIVTQCAISSAEAADKCIKPAEVGADKLRYVQTQLKVGVLQCNDSQYVDLPLLYGAFLLEKRPYLVRSQKPLQSYLRRSEKISIPKYLDTVANRISVESTKVTQFCDKVMLAAEFSAKAAHPATLLSLLPVAYQQPAAFCKKRG